MIKRKAKFVSILIFTIFFNFAFLINPGGIMKKSNFKILKVFFLLILISFLSINLFAGTSNSNYLVTFGGINGYIIAPCALPVPAGSFNLNLGYVFSSPNYLPLAFSFSFIKNWEIGFGHQFALYNPMPATPFFISTKYRISQGSIDIALGAIFELYQGYNAVELYAAFHSGSVFGKGMMDIVIGKTIPFDGTIDNSINLYIGTMIPLVKDTFLLLIDFSNNALGSASYMSDHRGIFNFSFIFDMIPKVLSIYFTCYDFMDAPFSTIGIGVDWRLSFK